MGYIYEFESETNELSKHLEKGLHHLGRAMSIAEDMCNYINGGEYGERNYPRMGHRNEGGSIGYRGGGSMGYRDDEMPKYDEYGYPINNPMGMRGRMRDSRGRFM